ncbi:probable serine incorporator [Papaver somniferum]|uniref:probable serine incorporator n=1 Tax=Papaver somniferum TaxID=3469 RepID=UPI000E6FCDB4|nr:probable serine incorporator [Papaver somniferum]
MSAGTDGEEAPIATVKCRSNTLEYSAERRKSLRSRYVYGFIFFLMNLTTWFIRDYGHNVFQNELFVRFCGPAPGGGCFHKMGVLRLSLGCFIFFLLMFLTTCQTSKLQEARNTWHSNWWLFKFVLLIITLVLPFFCPPSLIHLYGELARVGAGVFLLLQLVSVIQFMTMVNNYWMSDATLNGSCCLGLFMSIVFYIGSVCGIALMYLLYAPTLSCTINIFFISWTVILIIAMTVLTIHSKVRCLLSSGIMASYIVYLCWSAIRSEPKNNKCSPKHDGSGDGDWTTVLAFLIAICAVVMATFSTGIDSQSFQFQKEEVQHEEDIPYKYGFFHLVFSLGSMYFAMLFISWQLLDHPAAKRWSIDVGSTSTWVKIINVSFAAIIYVWKLILPVTRQNKVMSDQDKPMNNSTNIIP